MIRFLYISLFSFLCLTANLSADDWNLTSLFERAMEANGDILASRSDNSAACSAYAERQSVFFPKIFIEAGSVQEDLDNRQENYGYSALVGEWNLYRGGADLASRNQKALESNTASRNLDLKIHDVFAAIANEYYEILYLQGLITIYEGSSSIYKADYERAYIQFKAGIIGEVDTIEFLIQQEIQKNKIVALRKEVELRKQVLASLIGDPAQGMDMQITGNFPAQQCFDPDQLYQAAVDSHFILKNTEDAVSVKYEEYRIASAASLPIVDLRASYGTEEDISEERGHGTKVFLNVNLPLFTGGSTHYEKQKICHELAAIQAAQAQQKRALYTEIIKLTTTISILIDEYCMQKSQLDLLEKYLKLTKEEYSRGVKNSSDLLAATERMLEGKQKTLRLDCDYTLALISLHKTLALHYGEPGSNAIEFR
jgi:outer membrane protein